MAAEVPILFLTLIPTAFPLVLPKPNLSFSRSRVSTHLPPHWSSSSHSPPEMSADLHPPYQLSASLVIPRGFVMLLLAFTVRAGLGPQVTADKSVNALTRTAFDHGHRGRPDRNVNMNGAVIRTASLGTIWRHEF